jgi:hypothetical protein
LLTFRWTKAALITSSVARIGAAVMLSAMSLISAHADTLVFGGCVGAPGSFNCVARWGVPGDPYVRQVPPPYGEADKARAAASDQRWLNRCQPVISQDQYGVPRYHYAAAGCEFGVGQ